MVAESRKALYTIYQHFKNLPKVAGGQPLLEDEEGLVVALPPSFQLIPSTAPTGSSCISSLWAPLCRYKWMIDGRKFDSEGCNRLEQCDSNQKQEAQISNLTLLVSSTSKHNLDGLKANTFTTARAARLMQYSGVRKKIYLK